MRLKASNIVLIFSGLFLHNSCKTRETMSKAASKPVAVTQGAGNGLNVTGTGFVWEKAELPLCYSARFGIKFFVWKEQSTFSCDQGQKSWKLIAKK